MREIRIGVIGAGQIGKIHLENYKNMEGVKVAVIADTNEETLQNAAKAYGIPYHSTDFMKLLERDDLDAVDVCLHNNLHAPVTIAALKSGKHVYCEKPIAGSYYDGKAMLDTARKQGRKLHIQLEHLFHKESRAAKYLIDQGMLGEIYHARSTGYRRRGRPFVDGYGTPGFVNREISGGGALFDMGVYHISRMLYFLGMPEVKRISGKTYQKLDMDKTRKEACGFDVEELGLGFVRFAGDCSLDILEAWAVNLDTFEGSCIAGSRGGIRLSPFSYHSTQADMEMDASLDLDSILWRWKQLSGYKDAYDSSQRHWVAALQERVELMPTAELALQTMLISEGIYLSNLLDREVTAAEVVETSKSTALIRY